MGQAIHVLVQFFIGDCSFQETNGWMFRPSYTALDEKVGNIHDPPLAFFFLPIKPSLGLRSDRVNGVEMSII
jgi:hypothetical protein